MVHILKKIADWILEHEESEAENCSIPDNIIDEWLEDVKEHKKHLEQKGKIDSERYKMLEDIEKRVKRVKELREAKCNSMKKG